jgi:hypothetical protein
MWEQISNQKGQRNVDWGTQNAASKREKCPRTGDFNGHTELLRKTGWCRKNLAF